MAPTVDSTPTATPSRRPLHGALALYRTAPARMAALTLVAVGAGLALEVTAFWLWGRPPFPTGPATDAAGSGAQGLAALVYGTNGAAIGQWWWRWLGAQLIMAALYHAAPLPPLPETAAGPGWRALVGRLPAYLGALVLTAILVVGPASGLLALNVSILWLLPVLAYAGLRLAFVRQEVVLGGTSAVGALRGSWRVTRGRELFVGLYVLALASPFVALGGLVTLVAVLAPRWLEAVWWLAVALAWAWRPFSASAEVLLWHRLRERRTPGVDTPGADTEI
jgi:hypothetical protein